MQLTSVEALEGSDSWSDEVGVPSVRITGSKAMSSGESAQLTMDIFLEYELIQLRSKLTLPSFSLNSIVDGLACTGDIANGYAGFVDDIGGILEQGMDLLTDGLNQNIPLEVSILHRTANPLRGYSLSVNLATHDIPLAPVRDALDAVQVGSVSAAANLGMSDNLRGVGFPLPDSFALAFSANMDDYYVDDANFKFGATAYDLVTSLAIDFEPSPGESPVSAEAGLRGTFVLQFPDPVGSMWTSMMCVASVSATTGSVVEVGFQVKSIKRTADPSLHLNHEGVSDAFMGIPHLTPRFEDMAGSVEASFRPFKLESIYLSLAFDFALDSQCMDASLGVNAVALYSQSAAVGVLDFQTSGIGLLDILNCLFGGIMQDIERAVPGATAVINAVLPMQLTALKLESVRSHEVVSVTLPDGTSRSFEPGFFLRADATFLNTFEGRMEVDADPSVTDPSQASLRMHLSLDQISLGGLLVIRHPSIDSQGPTFNFELDPASRKAGGDMAAEVVLLGAAFSLDATVDTNGLTLAMGLRSLGGIMSASLHAQMRWGGDQKSLSVAIELGIVIPDLRVSYFGVGFSVKGPKVTGRLGVELGVGEDKVGLKVRTDLKIRHPLLGIKNMNVGDLDLDDFSDIDKFLETISKEAIDIVLGVVPNPGYFSKALVDAANAAADGLEDAYGAVVDLTGDIGGFATDTFNQVENLWDSNKESQCTRNYDPCKDTVNPLACMAQHKLTRDEWYDTAEDVMECAADRHHTIEEAMGVGYNYLYIYTFIGF